jgi:triphosphoribosyl-dephospho-CoA synthase
MTLTTTHSTASPNNLAALIESACLMEATARKPGNVHPGASFADLCHRDFVVSAGAVAPMT